MSISGTYNNRPYRRAITVIIAGLLFVGVGTIVISAGDKREIKKTKSATLLSPVPHLFLDIHRRVITVKLADVTLREYNFTFSGDSNKVEEKIATGRLLSSNLQTVHSVALLSAAHVIPETELEIISEETGLGREILQRYKPTELVIVTNDGLRVYIESNCPNAEPYVWRQVKDVFSRFYSNLLGNDSLRLRLLADDAMSLYGIVLNSPKLTFK